MQVNLWISHLPLKSHIQESAVQKQLNTIPWLITNRTSNFARQEKSQQGYLLLKKSKSMSQKLKGRDIMETFRD